MLLCSFGFLFVFGYGCFFFFVLFYLELTNYNHFHLRNKLIQAFVSFLFFNFCFVFLFFYFILNILIEYIFIKTIFVCPCVLRVFSVFFWFPVCIFPFVFLVFFLIKMNTYKNCCCVSFVVPYRFPICCCYKKNIYAGIFILICVFLGKLNGLSVVGSKYTYSYSIDKNW